MEQPQPLLNPSGPTQEEEIDAPWNCSASSADRLPDPARPLTETRELPTSVTPFETGSGKSLHESLVETLLTIAVEQAGAERGLLTLLPGDGPRNEAEAVSGPHTVEVRLRLGVTAPVRLPESVLNHVLQTRESVLLDDAAAPNRFSADAYIRATRARSILCLPAVKQATLLGVLYLENSRTPSVFTPAQVAALRQLAAHAAQALANVQPGADVPATDANKRPHDSTLRLAVNTIPDLVWTARPDGTCDFLNQRWLDHSGVSHEEAKNWGWQVAVCPEDRDRLLAVWRAALASGEPGETETRVRRFDGAYRWFLFRAVPLHDERGNLVKWYGTTTDIHDRKWAEALLAGENRLLEMIATGTPLSSILDAVCRLVEDLSDGCLCSILLLDVDTNRLRHGAAPSLPKTYMDAIDGKAIGTGWGPCGIAAYRKESVVVADVGADVLCAEYRDLALAHGLRACWSTPILSSAGQVLGTFAIYAREPGTPTPQHRTLIGQITHLAAVAIERNRIEAALQESEDRFRRMADTIPEVIWFTALKPEKVVYVSPSFEHIWGLSVDDLYRNPRLWTETMHPDDRERVTNTFARWIGGEEVSYHDVEYRIIQPNGATRWIHERGVLMRNEQGKAYLASGISTDITDRRLAEEAMRAARARFEGILEIAEDAIISTDSSQRITLFNHGAEKVFGYLEADVIGKPIDVLIPKRFGGAHRRHIEEFAQSSDIARPMGQRREVYGRRKDGREFPAEASISKLHLGGELVYTVILRDITDRKRAEEDLRRSEAYLAEAQRLSLTGSFGWHVSTGEIVWSRETFCILGYDPATKPALELVLARVHPEDIAFVRQTLERASRDGRDMDFEHRLMMPDGSVKHVHVVAHAVRDHTGALEFVGAVSDVTAAKEAEARIRQDERELRQIVEAIPALILVLTPEGRSLHANERVLGYTGLTLEDVRAGDFRKRVFHPADVDRLRDQRRRALARGLPFELEQRIRRTDGQYRWFLIHYNPLRDEQGHILRWYATGTDIDDRKRMEERTRNENLALRDEIDTTSMFEEIVGASPVLRAVLARVAKVAPTDSAVLITGETGTGKELVARAIHKRSPRAARAFVSVNCAAIPPALIASELFGHEKGAFTGALQRHVGRFELAEGGTLFLDEVGELPAETQVALLRVLQEREFERVGGTHALRADVRLLAAANRDLQAAIAAGTLRSDLFYRLNVFPIDMPPLRARQEDIPLLVEYFLGRFARKAGKRFRDVDRKTLALLAAYPWPGNIRELQNVIERSIIVCETETFSVDESWLSQDRRAPQSANPTLAKRPGTQEKEIIEATLAETRGRVSGPSGAAAKLGLPPSTLESKIRSLRINKHRFKPS